MTFRKKTVSFRGLLPIIIVIFFLSFASSSVFAESPDLGLVATEVKPSPGMGEQALSATSDSEIIDNDSLRVENNLVPVQKVDFTSNYEQ
ncbi:hypothetical protein [Streptococcus cuniculipharyngis]|uniref:Uncharacterized protein n=1 Tax=Streptococcus cuniculipharyngis TaxID=1562651 RepID=A0A5C5SF92_9STRE|nr:hypothetical protein [Streptococcus cuniculipharyngis]TWS98715.1 hypothetical protein FRX57_00365 [Streptococcus cuniculipharyngis]